MSKSNNVLRIAVYYNKAYTSISLDNFVVELFEEHLGNREDLRLRVKEVFTKIKNSNLDKDSSISTLIKEDIIRSIINKFK